MKGLLIVMLCVLPLLSAGADFMESVHAQGAEIAKEMLVDGSQVVWSPFSVVNILPLLTGDESLKTGFQTAINHFKELSGVEVNRISTGFVRDKSKVEVLAGTYGVEVEDLPGDKDLKTIITAKYKEEFGVGAPPGLFPQNFLSGNETDVFLTSLLLKAEWETPFKYAPKSKFFLNETHAVKTKYMGNIGFFHHGQITGLDADILALPLKNSTTTYFMLVVPKNSSALATVSAQFAQVQVGTLMEKLTKKRTQLMLPKITVDSQLLLQPVTSVRIIQSGSIRLGYFGFDNRVSKLRRTATKFLRSRATKQDLKMTVNKPFIYLVLDTMAGVLNYGEVLLPNDQSHYTNQFRTEEKKVQKLSQNARSLVDGIHEMGNNIFLQLKNSLGTFGISPIGLANLLASYALGADTKTQHSLFSTLDSKGGMIEINQNIIYINSTSSNITRILGGSLELQEQVKDLGTEVVIDESQKTEGLSEYSYHVSLPTKRSYLRSFYQNERDIRNVSFSEYIGHVKYLGLPFWDARAILIYLSRSQSLLIFVPNERSGLHLVENGLKELSVAKFLCQMRDRHARIRLPSFTVEANNDLLSPLKEVLGVNDINIHALGDIPIQNITQKFRFILDSRRDISKLSRYSYNKDKYGGGRKRPSTRINVDRPFIFYLLDNNAGTLAIGRVTDLPDEIPETPAIKEPETKKVLDADEPSKVLPN